LDFNSISELEKYLLAQIKSAMDKEVAATVKKEQSKQVKRYYDEFEPDAYERRGDNKGLSDVRNMKHTKPKINGTQITMTITNDTRGYSKFHPFGESVENLAGIVEEGGSANYNYPWGRNAKYFLKPRPFTSNTVYKLIENNEIIKTLKSALATRGLIVE